VRELQNDTLHIIESIAEPAWTSEKLLELDLTMEKEVDRGAERIKGTRVPGMARIVQVQILPHTLLPDSCAVARVGTGCQGHLWDQCAPSSTIRTRYHDEGIKYVSGGTIFSGLFPISGNR
jgi:hypothetical protein